MTQKLSGVEEKETDFDQAPSLEDTGLDKLSHSLWIVLKMYCLDSVSSHSLTIGKRANIYFDIIVSYHRSFQCSIITFSTSPVKLIITYFPLNSFLLQNEQIAYWMLFYPLVVVYRCYVQNRLQGLISTKINLLNGQNGAKAKFTF